MIRHSPVSPLSLPKLSFASCIVLLREQEVAGSNPVAPTIQDTDLQAAPCGAVCICRTPVAHEALFHALLVPRHEHLAALSSGRGNRLDRSTRSDKEHA